MDRRMTKVIESVYSLKNQRTLSYQIDQRIKQTPDLKPKQPQKEKLTHCKTLPSDDLKPMETFANISSSSKRRAIPKLYKSRLMPSQFLSTPAKVLNKLTQDLFVTSKVNRAPMETSRTKEPEYSAYTFHTSMTERYLLRKPLFNDSKSNIEASCKQMIEDNRSSRKILLLTSQIMNKKALLAKVLANKCIESKEKESIVEFKQRLKAAHKQLEDHDRIKPKKKLTSRELLLKSLI